MPRSPLPGRWPRAGIVTLVALLALWVTPVGAGAAQPLRSYRASGVRVAGGANAVAAPDLTPGLYRDTFTRAGLPYEDGTSKYYRIRLHKGTTPYVSVTEAPLGRSGEKDSSLRVEATLAPVDRSVSGCETTASGTGNRAGADLDNATAVVTPGEVGGADWGGCPTDAVYALHVTRSGSALTGVALPMEIAVREEPAGSVGGTPASAESATNVRSEVTGATRTVIGGTGFGDAPTLPTGRYRDSFTSGERRYYRVHLAWGQRLAWTFAADQLPAIPDYQGTSGQVVLANPVREVLAQPTDAVDDAGDLGATSGPIRGSTLVAAAWPNRRSEDTEVTPYAIDGDYYVIVSTAYPDSTQRTHTVPFVLTVQAVGTSTAGPDYAVDGAAVARTSSGDTATVISSVGAAVVVLAVVIVLLVLRRRQRPTQR